MNSRKPSSALRLLFFLSALGIGLLGLYLIFSSMFHPMDATASLQSGVKRASLMNQAASTAYPIIAITAWMYAGFLFFTSCFSRLGWPTRITASLLVGLYLLVALPDLMQKNSTGSLAATPARGIVGVITATICLTLLFIWIGKRRSGTKYVTNYSEPQSGTGSPQYVPTQYVQPQGQIPTASKPSPASSRPTNAVAPPSMPRHLVQ